MAEWGLIGSGRRAHILQGDGAYSKCGKGPVVQIGVFAHTKQGGIASTNGQVYPKCQQCVAEVEREAKQNGIK